jgi:hypothetical protein
VAEPGKFTPTQSPFPPKQTIGKPDGLLGQPFAPAQKSATVPIPWHEQVTD